MPKSCSAWGCKNRCTRIARSRGITFHKFPKRVDIRKQWEVALKRNHFSATRASVLCSAHFRPEEFDCTGQTVRLRDGVIPSVFTFPAHLQKHVKTRTTRTSIKAQESSNSIDFSRPQQSKTPHRSRPVQQPVPQPAPNDDHLYALPTSPSDITAKLNQALARVESLERHIRNAKDRERKAKSIVHALLEDLRQKTLINEELKERLDLCSGEYSTFFDQ